MIGDNVEVMILGTEGEAVRIGIKAPKQVQVYRSEIYAMIQESNREATKSVTGMEKLSQWMRKSDRNEGNDK